MHNFLMLMEVAENGMDLSSNNLKWKFRVKFKLLKEGNIRFKLKLPEEEHQGQVQIC